MSGRFLRNGLIAIAVLCIAGALVAFLLYRGGEPPAVVAQHPEMAELYRGCTKTMGALQTAPPGSEAVFCTCFVEEALDRLQPIDVERLAAEQNDGGAAAEAVMDRLTETQRAEVKARTTAFLEAAMPRCSELAYAQPGKG